MQNSVWEECFAYKVGVSSNSHHDSSSYHAENKIWRGWVAIAEKDERTRIILHTSQGELFGICTVRYGVLKRAKENEFNFALKIQLSSGEEILIGLGFPDIGHANEFYAAIQQHITDKTRALQRELRLRHHEISDTSVTFVGLFSPLMTQLLEYRPTFEQISFIDLQIPSDDCAREMLRAVISLPRLHTFTLVGYLTLTILTELSKAGLKTLIIKLVEFDNRPYAFLMDWLKSDTTITSVTLEKCPVECYKNPLDLIADVIACNTTLTSLKIQGWSMSDFVAEKLAYAIQQNTTLISIDIEGVVKREKLQTESERQEAQMRYYMEGGNYSHEVKKTLKK